MDLNLDNKTFRIVRNDGPEAEVDDHTVVHFRQEGQTVSGITLAFCHSEDATQESVLLPQLSYGSFAGSG
ncbi:MAG: hypothetical protein M3P51_01545 [Chloroflexota bacterium]|nr:hypothetical protein [Chloroflexota bacterium]